MLRDSHIRWLFSASLLLASWVTTATSVALADQAQQEETFTPLGWRGARFAYLHVVKGADNTAAAEIQLYVVDSSGVVKRQSIQVASAPSGATSTASQGVSADIEVARRRYASEYRPGKEIDVQLGAMDLVARDPAQNRDEAALAIATAKTAQGAFRIVPEVQGRATRVQVLGGRREILFELPAVYQCAAAGCAMGGTYVPFSSVVRAFESPDKRHWALVSASLAPAGWRRPQVSVTVIRSP